jgi:hypothetical protein
MSWIEYLIVGELMVIAALAVTERYLNRLRVRVRVPVKVKKAARRK